MFATKYMRLLAKAGGGVGILADQSMSELSTQITLNTMHIASHSAKYVTLGIPGLRNILMAASGSTTMTTYSDEEFYPTKAIFFFFFANSISVFRLPEILDTAIMSESFGNSRNGGLAGLYGV